MAPSPVRSTGEGRGGEFAAHVPHQPNGFPMQREVRPARGDGGAVTAKAQWAINYVTLDKMAWRTAPVLVPFCGIGS